MKPAEICHRLLGTEKLGEVVAQLTSPQIKAVLKEAGLKVKLPGGFVSQARRRQLWTSRVLSAVAESNQSAAGELLQQWLLHHRRAMLMAYLDALGVKHNHGETDDSFLLSRPQAQVREAAQSLMGEHDAQEVRAYLAYIAYQQRSNVFEEWAPLHGAPAAAGSDPPAGPEPEAAAAPPAKENEASS